MATDVPIYPNVIFSGSLCVANTTQMVLWSVMRRHKTDFGVLRISCPESGIEGDIGILWGSTVIGARCRGRSERGYDAIRLLLSASCGEYELIDLADSFQPTLDDGLQIRLIDLMSKLPELPVNSLELTCHRQSL